jgi:hypothetical protein
MQSEQFVEIHVYKGKVPLLSESFGDTIRLSRTRMDISRKEFSQELR